MGEIDHECTASAQRGRGRCVYLRRRDRVLAAGLSKCFFSWWIVEWIGRSRFTDVVDIMMLRSTDSYRFARIIMTVVAGADDQDSVL